MQIKRTLVPLAAAILAQGAYATCTSSDDKTLCLELSSNLTKNVDVRIYTTFIRTPITDRNYEVSINLQDIANN